MTIRTISQLPIATQIPDGSLFEISIPGSVGTSVRYTSNKLSVETLLTQFNNVISSGIANRFKLVNGNKDYQVGDLSSAISQLSSSDCLFNGTKTFKSIPVADVQPSAYDVGEIRSSFGTYSADKLVPNIGKVKDLIDDYSCFVGSDYVLDGDPGNDETARFTKKSEDFMYFRIDDNGVDSSKWISPETHGEVGYRVCPHTGYLTIVGWLADNGNVLPQNAWVALYGQVYTTSGTSQKTPNWIPLQVQPWPIGAKSSIRQYVGFNLPVKEGLRLKIKTGFRVNGSVGAMQDELTRSFNLNEPNCFVGWILQPK